MRAQFEIALAALLSAQALSSPLEPPSPVKPKAVQPTCTHTIFKLPPIGIDCTFYAVTQTATSYTDCGGCALETQGLGLGLPCREVHTLTGTTSTTVTACQITPTPTTTSAGYGAKPQV